MDDHIAAQTFRDFTSVIIAYPRSLSGTLLSYRSVLSGFSHNPHHQHLAHLAQTKFWLVETKCFLGANGMTLAARIKYELPVPSYCLCSRETEFWPNCPSGPVAILMCTFEIIQNTAMDMDLGAPLGVISNLSLINWTLNLTRMQCSRFWRTEYVYPEMQNFKSLSHMHQLITETSRDVTLYSTTH